MRKFHSIFIFLNLLISSPLFAELRVMKQLYGALPAIALSFIATLRGQRPAEEAIHQEAKRLESQWQSLQAPNKHTAPKEETRLDFEPKALLPIDSAPELKPNRIAQLIAEKKALESQASITIAEEIRLEVLNRLLEDTPWDDLTNENPKETKFCGKIQRIPGVYHCPSMTVEEAARAFPGLLFLQSSSETTEAAQVDNSTAAGVQAPAGETYTLIRAIGSGSSGTAFIATRNSNGEKVILKITNLSTLNAKKQGYTCSEIDCMRECEHFAIIRYLDHYASQDNKYLLLVMELADSGDLGRQIKSRSRDQAYFQEYEVAFLFLQVLLAVNHLHDKDMLCLDIKSANVFLMSNGIAKLGDFCFTQKYDKTISLPVVTTGGTQNYRIPPELLRPLQHGQKADVWSLGILLYEIAALKLPFVTNNMIVLDHVISGKYDPLPVRYSAGMHHLVQCMLNPDPEERPTTRQLLCHPYVLFIIEQFRTTIRESTRFTMEEKGRILTQLAAVEVSGLPRVSSGVPIQHSGTVFKNGPRGWKQRYLVLEGEKLTISIGTKAGKAEMTMSIRYIVSVSLMKPNVFALNLKDNSKLQFQAPSKQEYDEWVNKLSEAIGNFHEAHHESFRNSKTSP